MGMNDNAQEFLSANQVSVYLLGWAVWVDFPGDFWQSLAQILGALREPALLGHQEGPWRRSELAANPAAAEEQQRMHLVRGEGCACLLVLLCITRARLSHGSPRRHPSLEMKVQLVFLDAVRFPSIMCSSHVSFPHVKYFL